MSEQVKKKKKRKKKERKKEKPPTVPAGEESEEKLFISLCLTRQKAERGERRRCFNWWSAYTGTGRSKTCQAQQITEPQPLLNTL